VCTCRLFFRDRTSWPQLRHQFVFADHGAFCLCEQAEDVECAANQQSISGFCGTCHDTPNAGDHSVKAPLNIGVANAGSDTPPALDISGLPVFTVWCTKGSLAGKILQVTDIGRATITGQCADIGKLKGPILRGLAARAPYFHNGSAATLSDVVEFYDQRFSIGLTDQQNRTWLHSSTRFSDPN
jgi:cytochrome c peroxidase